MKKLGELFYNFFSNPNNALNIYLAFCYLYRDKIFDDVLDDNSVFVSTMLKKMTAYKTFIFIKYYRKDLEPTINDSIQSIISGIKNIMKS